MIYFILQYFKFYIYPCFIDELPTEESSGGEGALGSTLATLPSTTLPPKESGDATTTHSKIGEAEESTFGGKVDSGENVAEMPEKVEISSDVNELTTLATAAAGSMNEGENDEKNTQTNTDITVTQNDNIQVIKQLLVQG